MGQAQAEISEGFKQIKAIRQRIDGGGGHVTWKIADQGFMDKWTRLFRSQRTFKDYTEAVKLVHDNHYDIKKNRMFLKSP